MGRTPEEHRAAWDRDWEVYEARKGEQESLRNAVGGGVWVAMFWAAWWCAPPWLAVAALAALTLLWACALANWVCDWRRLRRLERKGVTDDG